MASVVMQCARCQSTNHSTKACGLPFYRTLTAAERRVEAFKRRAGCEARQAEKASKQAAWEEKEAERKAQQIERQAKGLALNPRVTKDPDVESECTDDTASTIASSMAF